MLSLGVVKWFLQCSCVSFCVSELHPLPAFPGKILPCLTKYVVHRKRGKSLLLAVSYAVTGLLREKALIQPLWDNNFYTKLLL